MPPAVYFAENGQFWRVFCADFEPLCAVALLLVLSWA
jgi:hypothetical protein